MVETQFTLIGRGADFFPTNKRIITAEVELIPEEIFIYFVEFVQNVFYEEKILHKIVGFYI